MGRKHIAPNIDPDLIIQEAMYGFVMALTFVMAVQFGILNYDNRWSLVSAIVCMDFVWGMIDFLVYYRLDILGLSRRINKMVKIHQGKEDEQHSREEIEDEFEDTIIELVDAETRDKIVDLIMESHPVENPPEVAKKNRHRFLKNGIAAALTTMACTIPAAICILCIPDYSEALLATSIISSLALFFIGYKMGPFDSKFLNILNGFVIMLMSLTLTVFAAFCGG
jgi:hypothetical protein